MRLTDQTGRVEQWVNELRVITDAQQPPLSLVPHTHASLAGIQK